MNANRRKAVIIGGGILLAVSVGLNLMTFGQLGELKSRIQNFGNAANQMDASIRQLDSQISALSQQISESSSLLAQSRVDVQLQDSSTLTVTVSVTPRELRPEDTVTVSVLDTQIPAVQQDSSFTAELKLPVFAGDLTPVVTIESLDGTKRMETLSTFSTSQYLELYYSFDFTTQNGDGSYINVGLQPAEDCVLTLPDDIRHIWLNMTGGGNSQQIEMKLDGKRIPDASGLPSGSGNKTPESSADSSGSGGLYYVYYTARLPHLEPGESFDLSARVETAGGIRYHLDIGPLDSDVISDNAAYGGGGNLSPEITDPDSGQSGKSGS